MKKLITIAALMCGAAHAEFFSGNDLLAKINSADAYDRALAIGYVIGVFDARSGADHCPPSNVTSGQVRDMVRSHLEATPATRHFTADVQVRYVLSKAWPCPKKHGDGV